MILHHTMLPATNNLFRITFLSYFSTVSRSVFILLLLLVHASLWFLFKPIAPGTDDLVYTWNAEMMAKGEYQLTDSPKNHRLTIIAPVALLIKVFGASPYVISLWPLLCSL